MSCCVTASDDLLESELRFLMNLHGRRMKYRLTAVLAVLVMVMIVAAASRRRSSHATASLPTTAQTIPFVTNKTKALTVTNVVVNGGGETSFVEATLLNQSSKFVNFYTFLIGGE